jgi:hypothetical protein
MAAPYVAGAAVLIRQAMEFAGVANITEDSIYDDMLATADTIYDAVTKLSYKRLNLQAAIDAIMPTDDFGSTVGTANDLGSLGGEQSVSGAIAKLNDADFFTFTASATGKATFEITQSAEEMAGSWNVYNAKGLPVGTASAGKVTLDVKAGETYTMRLASSGGLGHYTFKASLEADQAFSYQDWGAVAFTQLNGVAVNGEQWYRVEASQAGLLTVIGSFASSGGNVNVELYDANRQLIGTGTPAGGQMRLDAAATQGGQYFVRVTGTNSDVDFTLVNLVKQDGSTVSVSGTAGDDVFAFTAGSMHEVTVNGVGYSFDGDDATTFAIDGGGGNDSVVLTGTAGNDVATLRVGSQTLTGSGYSVAVQNVEDATVNGGGGSWDQASLYDSAGDDLFEAWPNHAQMTGNGYASRVSGFQFIAGYASTGNDRSLQHDSEDNDTFETWADHAEMRGGGSLTQAWGFGTVSGYSTAGTDFSLMHDTAGDDDFRAWTNRAQMKGAGYAAYSYNFYGSGALGTTGNDKSLIYDSAGDDYFEARPEWAVMWRAGSVSFVTGFDQAWGIASTGQDWTALYDSAGNDEFQSWSDRAQMIGPRFSLYAYGFDHYMGISTRGADAAYLHDSTGDDLFQAWPDRAQMSWDGYVAEARGFSSVYGVSSAGDDRAELYDSAGDVVYRAWTDRVQMKGAGYMNYAMNFGETVAYATGGHDQAMLNDSAGDDSVTVRDWGVRLVSNLSRNEVRGFDEVTAVASVGGNDTQDVEAVDYLFEAIGAWK